MTEATPDSKPSGFVSGLDRLLLDFSGRAIASARGSRVPWEHGGHSASAIILAAAAVEAHLGEWLARPENRKTFTSAAQVWKKKRTPTTEIARAIVKKVSKKNAGSAKWYTRLKALFELRNLVVHYSPEHRPSGSWPSTLEPYVRNHTIEPVGGDSHDWTSRVLVSSVAEQAHCIACEAIRGFDRMVSPENAA